MSSDEINYYSERAAIERHRADEATNPHVIRIHEELAALYERLISLGERPVLQTAEDSPQAPDLR